MVCWQTHLNISGEVELDKTKEDKMNTYISNIRVILDSSFMIVIGNLAST